MKVEQIFSNFPSAYDIALLDEGHIVTAFDALNVFNLKTGKIEQTVSSSDYYGHRDCIVSLDIINRDHIISSSIHGEFRVWNLNLGKVEQILNDNKDLARFLSVLDENRIIYSEAHNLKIWDRNNNQVDQIFDTDEYEILFHVLKLDDDCIVYIQEDRSVVFNIKTRKVQLTYIHGDKEPGSAIVLNTHTIAQAFSDGTIKIWNSQTGAVEQILTGHESRVLDIAQLDFHHIVSTSFDRTLKIWNLKTGTVEQTLRGHESSVNAVAVLDVNRIISASDDRTLKIWNLQTGKEIASIELDNAPQCVAVIRQENRLFVIVGDAMGAIYCLELVEPMVSAVC